MENARDFVEGCVLSSLVSCCKDFPEECKGCPDYVEEIDARFDVALTGWFGLYSNPAYAVRKCTRFNRKSYGRIESIRGEQ
jgi:hypothetical protein